MKKTDLDLGTLSESLSKTEKAEIFDTYWKAWSSNGFGTLTKKDSELLMFLCLKKALASKGKNGPQNNYDWAKLLRLTPTKIKTMRLESHLRFGHLIGENGETDIRHYFEYFHQMQSIDINGLDSSGDLHVVKVSFVVEDPVVQMEIENRLKEIGTYIDFHRNREVIKLRLVDFLKLAAKENEQKIIDQWVTSKASDEAKKAELKSRVSTKGYAQMSESEKLLAFVDDLAEFTQLKPLLSHLKRIFKSQSER